MSDEAVRDIDEVIVFRAPGGESFSLRDLKSNFNIINIAALELRFTDELQARGYARVRLTYEEHCLLDFTAPGPVPPDPTAPAQDPAPVKDPTHPGTAIPAGPPAPPGYPVPLALLRGRNGVEILPAPDSPRSVEPVEFHVFYKTWLRDWIESIIKALIILITIQFFVVQTFFIPTGSMKDTLKDGDYIMVEKVTYLFKQPERGDVVVFQFPNDPRKDFIKRMIAKARDWIEIDDTRVTVNNVLLREPYAKLEPEKDRRYFTMLGTNRMGLRQVSDDSIFVMGDNRDHSHDSRGWGDLPLYRMKGKAWLVYWPKADFGLIRHARATFSQIFE